MTGDVQAWIQNQTATNYGWVIKEASETSNPSRLSQFYTREYTTSTALRPKLSVTFTAPWDSYSDSGYTTQEDVFGAPDYYVYMKNTSAGSFANGTYEVTYYDADGFYVDRENGISVTDGSLQTTGLYLNDKTLATAGPGWHAVVQPSGAADPIPNNYTNLIAAPDTYQLVADDSFEVQVSAIPEFPTIMAAIITVAICAFAYQRMKKGQLHGAVRVWPG